MNEIPKRTLLIIVGVLIWASTAFFLTRHILICDILGWLSMLIGIFIASYNALSLQLYLLYEHSDHHKNKKCP